MNAAARPHPHFVVALTGGVASGKSAVAARFEALGVAVYDADAASRAAVAPGQPALAEIAAAFGADVLNADGTLDRRALRTRVFADASARATLEAIVHPRVRAWLEERVEADRGAYCILAIPLLVKARDDYAWVDRVLLVDAPEAVQVTRLMQRDGVERDAARRVLAAQASRAARRAIAHDVILNDRDEAALGTEVAALHRRYLELAARKRS